MREYRTTDDDSMIAGVCGGIAEYFDINPTLVRVAYTIGTFAIPMVFIVGYAVLAIVGSINNKK